jgi:hypothetical protein
VWAARGGRGPGLGARVGCRAGSRRGARPPVHWAHFTRPCTPYVCVWRGGGGGTAHREGCQRPPQRGPAPVEAPAKVGVGDGQLEGVAHGDGGLQRRVGALLAQVPAAGAGRAGGPGWAGLARCARRKAAGWRLRSRRSLQQQVARGSHQGRAHCAASRRAPRRRLRRRSALLRTASGCWRPATSLPPAARCQGTCAPRGTPRPWRGRKEGGAGRGQASWRSAPAAAGCRRPAGC